MIIYNKSTRIHIIKKILEKEFQRKYNWQIIQKNNNEIEVIPFTNLQKFIIRSYDIISIKCQFQQFQKIIRDLYINEIIKKIYQLYFQCIIVEYILYQYQESIKSLYTQSFFYLSTYDLKILKPIF